MSEREIWKPDVTVAAIVEHADGRFAIVDWGQELRAAGPRTALAVEEETAEA